MESLVVSYLQPPITLHGMLQSITPQPTKKTIFTQRQASLTAGRPYICFLTDCTAYRQQFSREGHGEIAHTFSNSYGQGRNIPGSLMPNVLTRQWSYYSTNAKI